MGTRILIEVAVDSREDAEAAARAGADRIELCGSLDAHGVTPSVDLVREVKKRVRVPVVAMVRPSFEDGGGTFVVGREQVAALLWDAVQVLDAGADGIVFGALGPGHVIDEKAVASLVAVAGERETVFHRAFDMTPDSAAALETLVRLGVTRVLSAGESPGEAARSLGLIGDGGAATGVRGGIAGARVARLRALVEGAAGRIEILPGGGVRAGNVADLVRATGVGQVHSSCRGAGGKRVDVEEVRGMRGAVGGDGGEG